MWRPNRYHFSVPTRIRPFAQVKAPIAVSQGPDIRREFHQRNMVEAVGIVYPEPAEGNPRMSRSFLSARHRLTCISRLRAADLVGYASW